MSFSPFEYVGKYRCNWMIDSTLTKRARILATSGCCGCLNILRRNAAS